MERLANAYDILIPLHAIEIELVVFMLPSIRHWQRVSKHRRPSELTESCTYCCTLGWPTSNLHSGKSPKNLLGSVRSG